MKKIFLSCSIILLLGNYVWSQSLAINTDGSTANASALLDVKSTDKGLLIPRMSKAQKNAIAVPATGLLIFQNAPDSIGFYYYGGSSWLWLTNTAQQDTVAWKTTGNIITNSNANFLGTINDVPLSFRQNNFWLGRWSRNASNYSIGDSAGAKHTTGVHNIAIGGRALVQNTSGFSNMAIGGSALENNIFGWGNIAIGASALQENTSGSRNTAVGQFALNTQSFNAGSSYQSDNTAIGNSAMYSNQPTSTTNGVKNVAVGNDAMYLNKTGSENTAVGVSALLENKASSSNTAIGRSALRNHRRVGNSYNTAVGSFALEEDTSGRWNTGVGTSAFRNNIIGVENAGIGINVGYYQLGSYNTFAGSLSGFGQRIVAANNINNTGQFNSGFGFYTLYSLANGTGNVAMGSQALFNDSSGSNNIGIGTLAGYKIITGNNNVAIGFSALSEITGANYNVAIGTNALEDNTTAGNTAVGSFSLRLNTIGNKNVAVGNSAMFLNSTGASNVAVGDSALYSQSYSNGGVLYATSNTAIGSKALFSNQPTASAFTGTLNVAVGTLSLAQNTSGNSNTGIGAYAVNINTTGVANTGVGTFALTNTFSGSGNVAIGQIAGETNVTGSENTYLGRGTDCSLSNLFNTTAIGAYAYVTQSNSMVLGSINGTNGATANTSVGIGTTTPAARLDVDANFKLGNNGSILNEIIKSTETYDIPSLAPGAVDIQTFAVTNATLGSVVSFSPLNALPDGITISYARVSVAGIVEVKVVNAGTVPQNPASMSFFVGLIR